VEEKGRLTVFGATVLELMGKRGITNWTVLSARLKAHGYDFKPPRISNWAYGRHAVNRKFGRALAEVLELNKEERNHLAEAFLFGQDERVGDRGWGELVS
jgi:hypothetical protein